MFGDSTQSNYDNLSVIADVDDIRHIPGVPTHNTESAGVPDHDAEPRDKFAEVPIDNPIDTPTLINEEKPFDDVSPTYSEESDKIFLPSMSFQTQDIMGNMSDEQMYDIRD